MKSAYKQIKMTFVIKNHLMMNVCKQIKIKIMMKKFKLNKYKMKSVYKQTNS